MEVSQQLREVDQKAATELDGLTANAYRQVTINLNYLLYEHYHSHVLAGSELDVYFGYSEEPTRDPGL